MGMNEISKEYFELLLNSFEEPTSLGIIGGRPNYSLYFIGTQESDLIFFDPHSTQDAVINRKDFIDKC